jgi:hypothetical protein
MNNIGFNVNRSTFTALSDTYGWAARNRPPMSDAITLPGTDIKGTVDNAKAGIAPFDVAGIFLGDDMRDQTATRWARYQKFWRYYEGFHHLQALDDGDAKTVFNYCASVVDKSVTWLQGSNGWTVELPKGNERLAKAINEVWSRNKRDTLFERLTLCGSVCGDTYLMVTVRSSDNNGKTLPKDKWRVVITPLRPEYCHPTWTNAGGDAKLKSCMVQYPQYGTYKGAAYQLYTVYITPEGFQEFYNDVKADPQDNLFGLVNIVHIPNKLSATSPFGLSDLEHLVNINVNFNKVTDKIDAIIDYHAEPTTVIFGARVSNLEKGSNRVWSNLPVDAKVENLQLSTDLAATYAYREGLKEEMHQLSETPAVAFDSKNISVTNTSGLAMQMMFQPLIEKTNRKRRTYGKGLVEANDLIIKALEICGVDLLSLVEDPEMLEEGNTTIRWTSVLPKDHQSEIDQAEKKISLGVWSQAEAQRRISDVTDVRRLNIEIAADQRFAMAKKLEEQKTINGMPFNGTFAFLSSIYLSDDYSEIATVVGEQDKASQQTFIDAKEKAAQLALDNAIKMQPVKPPAASSSK